MQSGKRLGQLAIAGVAVAALVTGCGSSGGGSASAVPSGKSSAPSTAASSKGGTDTLSVQALLASSADKSIAAKNAKIAISFKGSAEGKSIDFGGDGVVDFADKKLSLSLNLPAESGLSGSIEERVIDKVIYIKLPAAAAAGLGGKSWIKLDASEIGASSSTGLDSIGQNPADILGSLKSVSSSITKEGTAEIRGVETTKYKASIDLAKAAKASGSGSGLDSAAIEQYKKSLGSDQLPVDVYLDSDGLPRRVAISLTPTVPSTSSTSAQTAAFTVSIDYYDYGKADTDAIAAPPADEVGSLPAGAGLSG